MSKSNSVSNIGVDVTELSLGDFSSTELATALTAIDYRLFSKITPKDVLLKVGWMTPMPDGEGTS